MLINEGNRVTGGGVPGYSPYQDPELLCCWEDREFDGTATMPCKGPSKNKLTLTFTIIIDRYCGDCDCEKAGLGKYGNETMTPGGTDDTPAVDWEFNFHTICEWKKCKGSGDKSCSEGYPKTIGPFTFTIQSKPRPGRGHPDYGKPWPPPVNEILSGRTHEYIKKKSDRPTDDDGEQLNPDWPTPKGPGVGLRVPPHPKGEDLPSTDGAEVCCPEDKEGGNTVKVNRKAEPSGGFCR